jgi:hypothetical protein
MPFPSVTLTSTQYELLRGTASVNPSYRCRAYVSICPNDTVVACRVNGTPSGTSFIQFNYDSVTSGAIADVKVRQTVLISRTNDRRAAYFTGRVKQLPTGSTSGIIYINECSAAVADNDYVWIVNEYRIWPVLGRDDGGTNKKDYNLSYTGDPPTVTGLQTIYAGWVSSSSGKLRIAFSVSAVASVSGASISSYLFSFEGVTSVVSGSLSTNAVTIDFDPSAGVWGHLTVTDSGGRSLIRDFMVFPHNDTYPPLTGVDSISVTGNIANGWSAQMTAFTGVDSVLDNTLVCIWVDEKYNSTTGSLLAGTNDARNIAFVGRMRKESNRNQVDPQSGVIAEAPIELEGVGQQLNRLHGALIAEILESSPDAFDEIVNLTIWRGIVHLLAFHSTFLSLHDLSFDSTSDTFLCQGLVTQGSNLLDVINDLAQSILAAVEFAPDGACRVVRDPRYISTASRDALLTLANWTNADYIDYGLDVDHVYRVGKVTGDGGTYFNLGSINQVYPVLSIAPGTAQDYPEGSASLPRQVLVANSAVSVAQAELNERVGRHFAVVNNPTTLTMQHLDGWRWLIPSRGYWFTQTIASTTNVRGRAFTTSQRWLLESIQYAFNGDGTVTPPQCEYVLDINETTLGAAGDSVVYPDPGGTVYPELPALPPFDPYPAIPDDGGYTEEPPVTGDPFNPTSPARNGNVVIIGDDGHVWLTVNYLSALPVWREITPDTSMHYIQALFNPFPNTRDAWVLANDGTDSFVYYTADAFETNPTWVLGATVEGIYTALRSTDVSGGIMLYSPSATGGTTTITYDFTLGTQGFSVVTDAGFSPTNLGNYTTSTGFTQQASDGVAFPDNRFSEVKIEATIASISATDITVYYANLEKGNDDDPFLVNPQGIIYINGVAVSTTNNLGAGSGTFVWSGTATITSLAAQLDIAFRDDTVDCTGTGTITKIEVTGPGVSAGDAAVVYSTDNGNIFGIPVSVGATPGSAGAFDTQRVGDYSIAGADAQAYKATTKGGAYSSLSTDGATSGSDPILAVVPWSQWGSTALDNWSTSTPDYLLGSTSLVSSHCLWRVDGGGSRTAITPTGATAMISANCAATYLGTRAAVIASVSGTRKLFTSTNIGSSDTWTDRGATGATSDYIRPLRLSNTLKQLFWVAGAVAKFSPDFGATISTKNTPSAGTLLWIEPYG